MATTVERLDRFMARANAAYYATRDPFRDFTTAPEVSQVFGELLGAWSAAVWEQLGRPDPLILAELGPGRGTLMLDALRLIGATAPAFAAALRLHLVETSPCLRAILGQRLPDATVHESAGDLPPLPTILLANEFLDALPIRQFVRRGEGWTERHVAGGRFIECQSEPPLGPAHDVADGEVVERCNAATDLARSLGARAAAGALAALLIDYGDERRPGETLQALRGGRPADPLADPGEADLTAHVDFAAFADAARQAGARVHGPLPQGLFLARLGLYQRVRMLAQTSPDALRAANRLAQPERMGILFKALAIVPPDLPTPPGFDVP